MLFFKKKKKSDGSKDAQLTPIQTSSLSSPKLLSLLFSCAMTLPKNGVPAYAQKSGDAPGEIDDHGWHLGHSHNDHGHHHHHVSGKGGENVLRLGLAAH
jgi:hypothetical protein